jgi:hypothetical protein
MQASNLATIHAEKMSMRLMVGCLIDHFVSPNMIPQLHAPQQLTLSHIVQRAKQGRSVRAVIPKLLNQLCVRNRPLRIAQVLQNGDSRRCGSQSRTANELFQLFDAQSRFSIRHFDTTHMQEHKIKAIQDIA